MAIEIIPKKKEVTPPWQILIFVISIIILLASVLFYFFLSNQEKEYQAKIDEIKEEMEREAKEKEGKIKKISEINDRISTFSKIIQNHFFISDLFKLISDLTHPKVYYKNFDLNIEKNSLFLSGETENFFTLGQQILLFKENETIKGIDISKISKTKEGKVDFDINLILNPEIFKWKE
jgi:hypothetical protein